MYHSDCATAKKMVLSLALRFPKPFLPLLKQIALDSFDKRIHWKEPLIPWHPLFCSKAFASRLQLAMLCDQVAYAKALCLVALAESESLSLRDLFFLWGGGDIQRLSKEDQKILVEKTPWLLQLLRKPRMEFFAQDPSPFRVLAFLASLHHTKEEQELVGGFVEDLLLHRYQGELVKAPVAFWNDLRLVLTYLPLRAKHFLQVLIDPLFSLYQEQHLLAPSKIALSLAIEVLVEDFGEEMFDMARSLKLFSLLDSIRQEKAFSLLLSMLENPLREEHLQTARLHFQGERGQDPLHF
jgi:hypothetical protein